MNLRTPRLTVPNRTYAGEFVAFLHPLMFAPILAFMLWGTVLAPEPDLVKALLEFVGVGAGVLLGAYKINALADGGYAVIPDAHMQGYAVMGVGIYLACGLIAWWLYGPLVLALLLAGGFGIVIYNATHNRLIHNSATYGLVWGAFPVVLTYMYQVEAWPTLPIVALGLAAGVFGRMYTWNHGLRTCGIYSVCRRDCKGQALGGPGDPEVVDYGGPCHSNAVTCGQRLQMPAEVNAHAKLRQHADLAMVGLLTLTFMFL